MAKLNKLILTYLLNGLPSSFTQSKAKNFKKTTLIIPSSYLYYLSVHFKLSTVWYSTQLIEIFSYEVGYQPLTTLLTSSTSSSKLVLVYNFHNLFTQERLFLFTTGSSSSFGVKSVSALFSNANWLEREVSEMSGVSFSGKQDLRNLMLAYGDASTPLRKSIPSIGFKEISFDASNDVLIQTPVMVQI